MVINRIDAEALKSAVQFSTVAERYGIRVHRSASNQNEYSCKCPFHADGVASMSINDAKAVFNCKGCGARGSVFDFVARMAQCNFTTACKILEDFAGGTYRTETATPQRRKEPPKKTQAQIIEELEAGRKAPDHEQAEANRRFIKECSSNILQARDYIESRGLTLDFARCREWGFCQSYIGRGPRLIIPTGDGSAFVARSMNGEKPKYLAAPGPRQPWGPYSVEMAAREHYIENRVLFVTEGEIDAASLEFVGMLSIGIGGAQGRPWLLGELARLAKSGAPYRAEIMLTLDNDKAGNEGRDKLAGALINELGCRITTADPFPESIHDANEVLTKLGPEALREWADEQKKKVLIRRANIPEYARANLLLLLATAHKEAARARPLLGIEKKDNELNDDELKQLSNKVLELVKANANE